MYCGQPHRAELLLSPQLSTRKQVGKLESAHDESERNVGVLERVNPAVTTSSPAIIRSRGGRPLDKVSAQMLCLASKQSGLEADNRLDQGGANRAFSKCVQPVGLCEVDCRG